MSDVSVDIIKNRSGEAPDLPSGANLSGVSTAATLQVTNLNPTHINASGVPTATTFSGSLKSTGKPTLGLGVTINSSGINISGVATAGIVSATTLYGDGSNLTGVAMSIAPISYQPDVNDTLVTRASSGVSIGMTFTERVIAGSGNVTLRIAGAAGTVVENFGVGSSVTIANNTVSVTPTAALVNDTVYHISYPSGAFTNTAGDVSYVGTAYTFTASPTAYELWVFGSNQFGMLGLNQSGDYLFSISSPDQVGSSTDWGTIGANTRRDTFVTKTDGTLWGWGRNQMGQLGINNAIQTSSPTQIPGTTWANISAYQDGTLATKTDGTLWTWGRNSYGVLGQNESTDHKVSSPVQVPGTTWNKVQALDGVVLATRTDGTLWAWGRGDNGSTGQNNRTKYSSPVQIPGTNWNNIGGSFLGVLATKTDGTLWSWGYGNTKGALGLNDRTEYSSPTQIPGTTWNIVSSSYWDSGATKTDGTLWCWGDNTYGQLGQNNRTQYSSPVQVPGSTWNEITRGFDIVSGLKTDGTLWTWGRNQYGGLGQNQEGNGSFSISSPVQIPGTDWSAVDAAMSFQVAIKAV